MKNKIVTEPIEIIFDEKLKEESDSDPCWENYKILGIKIKNGKKVPNCVPKKVK
jgi:hypothetical protein